MPGRTTTCGPGAPLSFLPRAADAAPSLFHPAALSRRLGLAALRSALEAGYDEVCAHAQAGSRRTQVEVAWVAHRAREICSTLVSTSIVPAAADA